MASKPNELVVRECLIRDLRSARHYQSLFPDRPPDPQDPESGAFYELRASGYRKDLDSMAKLTQTQETIQSPIPELTPETRTQLAATLDTIKELKFQRSLIDEVINTENSKVFETLEIEGLTTITIGDQVAKIIRGRTSKLNKLKLFAAGITQAQLDDATEHRPKKPYLDIRQAGEVETPGEE